MAKIRSHIAFLLLLIFTITFIPFNAIHRHEEDVHRMAMITHEEDHSCQLDETFCQVENTGICGHQHHLSTPLERCFTCQFHFEKSFDAAPVVSSNLVVSILTKKYSFLSHLATEAARDISNKGPPSHC